MIKFFSYFLFIVLFTAFPPSPSSAATYKWVDPGGIIHFSDSFEDIPLPLRKDFKIVGENPEMSKGMMIPFEKTPMGLILVNVVLNDRVKARLILDTGANFVVITEELSKKLGQDLSSRQEVVKLHTNCGEVEGTFSVIRKIELEGAWKENVRAVITPIGNDALKGFDGLLGLSFLVDFKITVDYPNGKIILKK
jgi:clan AA aspartic protease (TIGR02281 family)